jgi:hypothetical protein
MYVRTGINDFHQIVYLLGPMLPIQFHLFGLFALVKTFGNINILID